MIRRMQVADLPQVVRIEASSYDHPWPEGVFRDYRKRHACHVMELNGEVAGYLILGDGHVLNLCVAPKYRRQGVARKLLEHAFEFAAQGGFIEVILETHVSNTAARELYRSMGFEPIGRRKGYYYTPRGREDALVLTRQVA
jgi:ribosomal-protein-alanine N-acetyltransferase